MQVTTADLCEGADAFMNPFIAIDLVTSWSGNVTGIPAGSPPDRGEGEGDMLEDWTVDPTVGCLCQQLHESYIYSTYPSVVASKLI